MYILCQAKRCCLTQTFENGSFSYHSMMQAFRESKLDETCIEKVTNFVFTTLQMNKQSIGEYDSMIEKYFDMPLHRFNARRLDCE